MSWKAALLTACLLTTYSSATSDANALERQDRRAPLRPVYALSYSNGTTMRASCSPQHHNDALAATVDQTSQPTAPYSRQTTSGTGLLPRPTSFNNDAGIVNAVNATLKFWWTTTAYLAVSTVMIQFDTNDVSTGWTVYAATGTFNTASAITTTSCSPPYATGTYQGTPYTLSYCNQLATHVAATTSALYVQAFQTPSVTTARMTPLPNLQVTPPPAQIALAAQTFPTGTPFVQFSEYEVVKCAHKRNNSCRATTQRYTLSAPYAFSYTGPNPALATNVDAAVTGQLDKGFAASINRTSLVPGSWSAPPTVIIVVDRILVAVAVLAAHVEQTASTLDLPTAVLPNGYSALPQTTPAVQDTDEIYPTAHVEVTQSWLLVPGTPTAAAAHITYAQVTKNVQETKTTSECVTDCPAHAVEVAGATTVPLYVADGKTAYKGGGAITVGAQTVSVFASGNSLLVWDGTTTKTIAAVPSGVLTVNGMRITATSAVMYPESGQILIPGGSAVTVDGVVMYMPSSGGLQIGSQATSTTSAGGIATHIVDGLGGTTTTSGTGMASETATAAGNSAVRSSVDHAWWLATFAALGLAWYAV